MSGLVREAACRHEAVHVEARVSLSEHVCEVLGNALTSLLASTLKAVLVDDVGHCLKVLLGHVSIKHYSGR